MTLETTGSRGRRLAVIRAGGRFHFRAKMSHCEINTPANLSYFVSASEGLVRGYHRK